MHVAWCSAYFKILQELFDYFVKSKALWVRLSPQCMKSKYKKQTTTWDVWVVTNALWANILLMFTSCCSAVPAGFTSSVRDMPWRSAGSKSLSLRASRPSWTSRDFCWRRSWMNLDPRSLPWPWGWKQTPFHSHPVHPMYALPAADLYCASVLSSYNSVRMDCA